MSKLTQEEWEKTFLSYHSGINIMPETAKEKEFDNLLNNGEYDNVSIYYLFDKYQYGYLKSLLRGAYKKGDVDTFNEIVKRARDYFDNPNGSKLSSKEIYNYFEKANYSPEYNLKTYSDPENYYQAMNANIKGNCLSLLSLAIKLASNKDEFKTCVKDLEKSDNENIRLVYTGCIDYKSGLKDDCARVRELAKFIKKYKEDMKQYDEHTKDVIDYITYLCNNYSIPGVEDDRIMIMDGLCGKTKNNIEYEIFRFSNFSKYEYIAEESGYHHINEDVMYKTCDDRIDGYVIYNLMKSKKLKKGKDFDSRFADYCIMKNTNIEEKNAAKTLKI